MHWFEDDEMMRRWEDVSTEEEKITVEKMEGESLQVEGVQKAPELLVFQVLTKEKDQRRRRKKSKLAGRSTEKMEEKARKHDFKDTEEMVQWRSINQEKSTMCGNSCREK